MEVGKMMDHKRSPCSVEQNSLTSLASKRHKADLSAKERKEKLGERIVALQQLVSPYGKTDTASVLWEAMEYIRFLHEQVKLLSAPYLQATPSKMQVSMNDLDIVTTPGTVVSFFSAFEWTRS
uniref:BHLH domain-containing protein n=1 Tax=Fagus sylvatica TaxID=28930 RepID=A0A2N9GED3_FAGSY